MLLLVIDLQVIFRLFLFRELSLYKKALLMEILSREFAQAEQH
jgi:hypothetical protein